MSRIEDAGRIIPGARRDFYAKPVDLAELSSATDAEAIELAVKDRVWPEPDWAALVEGGVTREQAAFAKLVRKRIAAKPAVRVRNPDPDKIRRDYVMAVGIIRDVLEKPIAGGYSKATAAIVERLAAEMAPYATNCVPIVAGRSRTFPFSRLPKDISAMSQMISEGFPAEVPAWRKGVTTRRQSDGTWSVGRTWVIASGLPTEEAALQAAKEDYEKSKGTKKKRPSAAGPTLPPDRPAIAHLDDIERVGPDHRDGDVSPDMYVEELGFAAVQFGNWVPQGERQRLLNEGWDSIHDMAEIMGMEPRAMSLGGTLSIAFGSRGSGRAAAHYEPGQLIFNMTRMNGAGSLAHEFAHAIDHWIGETNPDRRASLTVRSASGWNGGYNKDPSLISHVGQDFANSFVELMARCRLRPRSDEDKTAEVARLLADGEKRLAEIERRLAEMVSPSLIEGVTLFRDTQAEYVAGLRGPDSLTKVRQVEATEFARDAVRLDGSGRDYRKLPHEMLARSFESWVFDRLAELGRKNDYLVHGVEEDRYADPELFKGNPYPVGRDRLDLNALFDRVMPELADYANMAITPDAAPKPR